MELNQTPPSHLVESSLHQQLDFSENRSIEWLQKEATLLEETNQSREVVARIASITVTEQELQQRALVEAMKADSHLNGTVISFEMFKEALVDIVERKNRGEPIPVRETVNALIREYRDIFPAIDAARKGLHDEPPMGLEAHLLEIKSGYKDLVDEISAVGADFDNPALYWQVMVNEHIVSPEFVDEIDLVSVLFETHHKLKYIGDSDLPEPSKRAMVARVGLDMAKKGVPATLFVEALQDPERFGPDFLGAIVGNYLNIAAAVDGEREDGMRLPLKAGKIAAATILAGSLLLTGDVYHPPMLPPAPVIEQAVTQPLPRAGLKHVPRFWELEQQEHGEGNGSGFSPDNRQGDGTQSRLPDQSTETTDPLGLLRGYDIKDTRIGAKNSIKISVPSSQGKNGGGGSWENDSGLSQQNDNSSDSPGLESKDWGDQHIPKNDSLGPETFADPEQIWEMEGREIPADYYRTATADDFGMHTLAWSIDASPPTYINGSGTHAAFTIATQAELDGSQQKQQIDIPMPLEYSPTMDGTVVTVDGQAIDSSDVTFSAYEDGTFALGLWTEGPLAGTVNIQVGAAEDLAQQGGEVFDRYKDPIITDVNRLPEPIREWIDHARAMRQQGSTDVQIARYIRDQIQSTFTYSLNPDYSDYYLQASEADIYFERLFTKRHGDCDVVNTGEIALLRELGIPSRFARGFTNIDGSAALDETERHGWAEVYDAGQRKWVPMDATPSEKDSYTEQQMGTTEGVGSPLKQPGKQLIEALLEKQIRIELNTSKFLNDLNYGEGGAWGKLGLGTFMYTFGRFCLYLWGRRNRERYDITANQFRDSLYRASRGKSWNYADRMGNTLEELNPFHRRGIAAVFRRILANTLVVPGAIGKIGETNRQRAFEQQVEALSDKVMQEAPISELLTKAAGVSPERVLETIESKNKTSIQFNAMKHASSELWAHLTDKGFKEAPYIKGLTHFALDLLKRDITINEFYEKLCRQYYLRVLTARFPRSHIYEDAKALGGFEQFAQSMPEGFKRAIAVLYMSEKGFVAPRVVPSGSLVDYLLSSEP